MRSYDETEDPMRENYTASLDEITTQLAHMTADVRTAVKQATTALLDADLAVAEQVISDDARIDDQHDEIEAHCFNLLARQAPVATDLRTIVAALRMIADLGRMGDLAAHIAKIARMRFPERALPASITGNFARMAEISEQMVSNAGQVLTDRDIATAQSLANSDEEMDELRREQFRIVLGQDWEHGVEAAVDVALLGRYYERIADHSVALGRRLIYLVTGEAPEGEDWPTT